MIVTTLSIAVEGSRPQLGRENTPDAETLLARRVLGGKEATGVPVVPRRCGDGQTLADQHFVEKRPILKKKVCQPAPVIILASLVPFQADPLIKKDTAGEAGSLGSVRVEPCCAGRNLGCV